jgi:hypothetical protein
LISLDYSVSWTLDSCWITDNTCNTNIKEDTIDTNDFSEYYEYTDEYNDYDIGASTERITSEEIRKKRATSNEQNSTKLTYSHTTSIKLNKSKSYYETNLNIKLNVYNIQNVNNKRYLSCYLKPLSACELSTDDILTRVSFK